MPDFDTFTNYKVTADELSCLVADGIITKQQEELILSAAYKRLQNQHAQYMEKFDLNPAGTARIQNVAFYGGEHFGKPYCFVAEIVPLTTRSAWSRLVNKLGLRWLVARGAFTY